VQLLGCVARERDLGSARDEHHRGIRDVAHGIAAREIRGRDRTRPAQRRQLLARERQQRRTRGVARDPTIRRRGLEAVRGTKHVHVRDRAQRVEMLDRLMRGPVLT
jgi:hypothetical protein